MEQQKINLIFRENMDEAITNIKKEYGEDVKFYSISKINNFNTCPHQFYQTYIAKNVQKAGVYGVLGTACHSDLETLYENEEADKLVNEKFNSAWQMCELFKVNFPVSRGDIKGNYKKDIDSFYNHYKKIEGHKFISELGFLLKIDNKHFLMGYIDLIEFKEDGTIAIIDFKTSAMFKDKKLVEAGRQLCIYQMAMEQLYGLTVVDNGWQMLKYLEVKVGNNKPKVVSGRELVEKISSQVKTLMKKNGVSEFEINMYITKATQNNDISCFPDEIKEQIKINTYYLPYDVTEEVKKECIEYITGTIEKIESMDKENIEVWEKSPNDFFCKNLCGYYPKYCNM